MAVLHCDDLDCIGVNCEMLKSTDLVGSRLDTRV